MQNKLVCSHGLAGYTSSKRQQQSVFEYGCAFGQTGIPKVIRNYKLRTWGAYSGVKGFKLFEWSITHLEKMTHKCSLKIQSEQT